MQCLTSDKFCEFRKPTSLKKMEKKRAEGNSNSHVLGSRKGFFLVLLKLSSIPFEGLWIWVSTTLSSFLSKHIPSLPAER